MLRSYPSIYAVGHRLIEKLFANVVVVQEKVDGSQFSFGLDANGGLCCRSKGSVIHADNPEKMFSKAVETVKAVKSKLVPGWIYRCEYLRTEKHNTLTYGRVPAGNLVLFDVMHREECYLGHSDLKRTAEFLGIDAVPQLHCGLISSISDLASFLDRESFLGGCKIEGVVVKNYDQFGDDKKILIGKFVSPEFKEKHQTAWKKTHPTQADVVQHLVAELKTEARWRKAVQHLRDDGKLTETPQDIGLLIKEVQADVKREEETEIKEALFKHFWPQIQRGIIGGLPEFYKGELAKLHPVVFTTPTSEAAA